MVNSSLITINELVNGSVPMIGKDIKKHILNHISSSVMGAHAASIRSGSRVYSDEQIMKFIKEYPAKLDEFLERSFAAAIAYNDEMLVGTSFASAGKGEEPSADREECFLYGNYVAPGYHGMNIGKSLLNAVRGHAVERGYTSMSALATLFPGTLEFYKKAGFETVKRTSRPILGVDFQFDHIRADLTR